MTCNGPFKRGTGEFCGCKCGCCPPCPCYTKLTYTYACGSSNELYPDEGCNCPETTFKADTPELPDFPDFPDFNLDEQEFTWNVNGEIIFQALNVTSLCSIPCEVITIVVDFSGCCLHPKTGNCYYAIGSGVITATAQQGCDKDFQVLVNGENILVTGPYYVDDDDEVCIVVVPPEAEQCCSCCLTSLVQTPVSLCPPVAIAMTKRNVTTGINKAYLNKKVLIQKIKKRTK